MMTKTEAQSVVAQMIAETNKPARIRLFKTALKIGKLSDDARKVYRNQLSVDMNNANKGQQNENFMRTR